MSDATTTLIGNVTRDPELRYGTGGVGVLSLGLAVNKRKQVNGEWEETTSFFNVVLFGDMAENAAATVTKGTRVIATGELVQREYETKEGEKRSSVELVATGFGPDLRWATAEVTRAESKGAGKSKGASKPRQQQQASFEEEPF